MQQNYASGTYACNHACQAALHIQACMRTQRCITCYACMLAVRDATLSKHLRSFETRFKMIDTLAEKQKKSVVRHLKVPSSGKLLPVVRIPSGGICHRLPIVQKTPSIRVHKAECTWLCIRLSRCYGAPCVYTLFVAFVTHSFLTKCPDSLLYREYWLMLRMNTLSYICRYAKLCGRLG